METPKRIFIVEDDFLVAEKLRGMLEDEGHTVIGETADGREAVERVAALRPDVVMMDLELAGINGIAAARRIAERCPTPVVALTAYDTPDLVSQASAAGVGYYLVKPATRREVARAIEIAAARFDDMQALRRLNAALQESERRYALAQGAADISSWDWDIQADTLHWSEHIETLLGLEPGTFEGTYRAFIDRVHPEDRPRLRERVEACLEEGREYQLEHRIAWPDGTVRWLYQAGDLVRDERGEAVRLVGIVQDITARKRREGIAQARMRLTTASTTESSRALMRMALDEIEALTGSEIGFYHFLSPDQETVYLQTWSSNTLQRMCNARGHDRHYAISEAGVWVEAVHRRRPVIHNDYVALPHRRGLPPGHAPVVRELVVPVMRGERVVAILGVGNKPTGYDDRDVEIATQLGDFSWELVQRKRAEEQLRRSRDQLSALIQSSPLAVIALTPEGEVTLWNPAAERIFGWKASEAVGHFAPIVPPEKREEFAALRRRVLRGETILSIEIVRRRQDGSPVQLSLSTAPLRDAQGRVTGIMSLLEDITARKLVERALRESERNLSEAQRIAHLGSWEMDVATGESRWSDEFFRICGYEPGAFEPTMERGLQLIHPDDREDAQAVLEAAIEARTPYRVEKRIVRPDGEVRDVLASGEFVYDDAGRPVKLVGTFLDITERKRAEEALRASERRLDRMLQTLVDGVVRVNGEGQITYANPAAERILEMRREEIEGRNCGELSGCQIDEGGDPLPLQRLPLAQALGHRRDVEGMEYGLQLSTGERKWLSVNAAPLVDESGAVYGAIASFRDVTQRKWTEEALRESEERYKEAERIAHFGSWEMDIATGESRWSDEFFRICGYEPGSITPNSEIGFQIIHPEDRDRAARQVNATIETGTPYDIEKRIVRPDGVVRWVRSIGEVVRDGEGNPVKLVGSFHDITERQRAQEAIARYAVELERSNRELEQFAYVISHDLQEPLRMVSGYLRLLKQRYQGVFDVDGHQFIAYAVDGAERMQEMIRAMLDLSRVETRGQEPAPTDAQAVLERTLKVLGSTIEETEARVTYDHLPTVLADRAQLAQVFQNLIANGIKFRRPGVPPRVHVSAEWVGDGDGWRFAVADNGIGLDLAHEERIFQIFQRLHTEEEYPGTGIGLALCKRIVERHGGRIWVEAEPGAGAVFHFTLPGQEEGL
jgi:PAS domain S-box-containing protein